jgi:sterol desaturase/sphingolipid hydroxylase (fatty acid hydroxylase superfamily)
MTLDAAALQRLQFAVSVVVLLTLWLLEAWVPLFVERPQRLRHAGRNLAVAGINMAIIGLGFAGATAGVAAWAEARGFGLLHRVSWPLWAELPLALLLFDLWMYLWHRANHAIPFLWRFHRMHHTDPEMDVTTALRFHCGEIALSSMLRLAVIPLLGLELWQVILYEIVLLPVIAFHHSNVALPEKWDRLLRAMIVSPNMHRVHHSDWQPETDSNFASVFSWWDRLWRTFRLRKDVRTLRYGLREFDGKEWQTISGLLRTPLANQRREERSEPAPVGPARRSGETISARRTSCD